MGTDHVPHRDPGLSLSRGLRRATTPLRRPNPLVLAWRWRYELVLLLGIRMVVERWPSGTGTWRALSAVAVVAGAMAALPAVRRLLRARFWCIATPHRVRVGCAQEHIQTRRGTLPAVLWTSSTPYGERVLVWCRAGTAPADFDEVGDRLAAACWARELHVERVQGRAHLVALLVVRRRPPRPARAGGQGSVVADGGYTWSQPPGVAGLPQHVSLGALLRGRDRRGAPPR